jgi:hypothetical protein
MLRLIATPNGKNLNCCLDDAPLRLPPDASSAIRLISVHDITLAVSAHREHGWHRPKGFYIRHQNDLPFSRMDDFGKLRLLETSDRSKIEEHPRLRRKARGVLVG